MVAGTGRLLEAIAAFRFGDAELERLSGVARRRRCCEWLADYRFSGDIDGYAEGELFFPGSPILTVSGTFADAVVLETLVLSVLNHDCAVAAAAARMVTAAAGRPLIEMGSRRTHEEAAVAAARAAYLAGFAATSNLEAGRRYGIPTAGTAAHAFTLLHDDEQAAFAAQVGCLGTETTLLVDTYDITQGISNAVAVGRPGARRRSGSTPATWRVLAAPGPRAARRAGRDRHPDRRVRRPGRVRDRGAARPSRSTPTASGTSVVTGSGAPTAGLVYKLVEVDGRPVVKRSASDKSHGRRAQDRGAPAQADRHGGRGGRVTAGRPARARPARPAAAGAAACAAASRSTTCRRLEESREHLRAAPDLDAVGGPQALRTATRRSRPSFQESDR